MENPSHKGNSIKYIDKVQVQVHDVSVVSILHNFEKPLSSNWVEVEEVRRKLLFDEMFLWRMLENKIV